MGLIDGDAFVSGDILSFQQIERIKDNFIQSDPQTNLTGVQDGMESVDSDDDKIYLYSGSAWEEILQLTRSLDVSPQFASARLMDTNASHYLDVIWNEDDSANRILNLLVNSGNVDLDIDTKEVLGVGQVLRENLIGNSGFGLWSQSDAAKGLASLTYDTGDDGTGDIPDVGDACTGDDSGATGKIISMTIATGTFAGGNATGVITLGAVTGCFNDNEALSFTDGETAVVNQPDGAVGADGIVKNGHFATDNDPPNDWDATDCALTTEAGGQVGNCLMITRTGAAFQFAGQDITLELGKIYKYSFYVKSGTSGNESFQGGIADRGGAFYSYAEGTSAAGWVQYTGTWECTDTTVEFDLIKTTATAGTMYFDEVTLYEITPCCTAVTTVAFDGGFRKNTLDIYRQHNDGGTLTKDGSFYSLKTVPTVTSEYIYFFFSVYNKAEHMQRFAGRKVTFGVWAKTSTASHFRIGISSGADTLSSFHTGGGGWEWLEVTQTVGATPTSFIPTMHWEAAIALNGDTIVYLSQPMLVFGSYIGQGNYKPIPQEIIHCEKAINSNLYNSTTGWSDVAFTDLNLEADSDAMLPKGIKMIFVHTEVLDSGAGAASEVHVTLRADATAEMCFSNSVAGLGNSRDNHLGGVQACDVNGDVDIHIDASGAGNLDIPMFHYCGIQM